MITLSTIQYGLPHARATIAKYIVGKVKDTQTRQLFYVGSERDETKSKKKQLADAGFKEDDIEAYSLLSTYQASDIAEIFGNDMEDRNLHRHVHLFQNILNSIHFYAPGTLSDRQKCLILCEIYEYMFGGGIEKC